MSDLDRFRQIAEKLSAHLQLYGLRPSRIVPQEENSGWSATVAFWGQKRPHIAVWFDRSLNLPQRVFWFGFQSSNRALISKLVKEVGSNFPTLLTITVQDWTDAGHWQLTADSANQLESSRWLSHESYTDNLDDDDYFGVEEFGFQFDSDEELAREAAKFIGRIILSVDPSLAVQRDIKEITDSEEDPTTRERLILARRGQGKFRSDLFEIWRGCAVTACTVPEVLRASHIQPWRISTPEERLDPENGLLLNATLDALFDRGLITFDDDGAMLISPAVTTQDRSILALEKMKLSKKPSEKQVEYLKSHRRDLFIRTPSICRTGSGPKCPTMKLQFFEARPDNLRSDDRDLMTEKEAFAGFPVSGRERKALDACCDEGARLPKGVATQTRQNLLAREWIGQTGIDEQYLPIYVTTSEGLLAIQIDDLAIERGLRRPLPASSMARQGAYERLPERLNWLRGNFTSLT